ncbi:hypothetical protein RFI_29818 [Reticulomyxa filosa]|uniref:VLIG-type G domain-containing protein n=1 Tax=Reticulomyxa filosa TaxID=46433 RepID=X6M125_RETFI|nr:hypothetical protein RFI_29818 [Reticulomyxa filosa]|eukprot:ETO07574.1 hypothetical protein RFI_29818 [Reticulomyxa filosa]
MGKQSTGKSYMLNHLLGCKFDISGARCTDGVWITARIAGDVLYVILDFEGLGSFERSPQEDVFLFVFNAAISNCTIFRCENRFDQDIAEMFKRFQKGVQFLQDDNDKLFRGRLLIVVKDIPITDIRQVMDDLSSKIKSFCRNGTNGESESFVMQMYKDVVNIHIEPYPPLMHELFFKKLDALRILIEGSPKTHSDDAVLPSPIVHVDGGIPFLRHMKVIMAKLAMKDWNSNLSDQIVESAVERVKQHIKSVINFGTLAISKEQESLERFDITENMEVVSLTKKEKIIVKNSDVINALLQKLEHVRSQSSEQLNATVTEQIDQLKQRTEILEKMLDNIPNTGLNLIHNNILKWLKEKFESLCTELKMSNQKFEKEMSEYKRNHFTHKQWFNVFQLFLKLIYLRREMTLEKWIASELHEFGFQTLREYNTQEQKIDTPDKRAKRIQDQMVAKFVRPLINSVLNQLQAIENLLKLCGAKCKDCYFQCLLRQAHQWNGEHNCLGSHQCDQPCSRCKQNEAETKENALPCQLQSGHEMPHNCRDRNHTCGKDCSLKQYGHCYEKCGLEFGQSSEAACICNSIIHYCNQNCSLSEYPNKCEIDYTKEHTNIFTIDASMRSADVKPSREETKNYSSPSTNRFGLDNRLGAVYDAIYSFIQQRSTGCKEKGTIILFNETATIIKENIEFNLNTVKEVLYPARVFNLGTSLLSSFFLTDGDKDNGASALLAEIKKSCSQGFHFFPCIFRKRQSATLNAMASKVGTTVKDNLDANALETHFVGIAKKIANISYIQD